MSCNHENCRLQPDDMLGKCTCGDCGEKVDIDDAINAKLAKVDRFLKEAELRVMATMYPPASFVNPFNKPEYGPSALTPPDEHEGIVCPKCKTTWASGRLFRRGDPSEAPSFYTCTNCELTFGLNFQLHGQSALTQPDETVEVKKGTFEWALAMMKQGKKVRRQVLTMDGYMYYNRGAYFMSGARPVFNIHTDNLVATDWQIVEEAHP
jgi:DNA-directed RNA polymerase subunit M/transcription elongation factor TFIIS